MSAVKTPAVVSSPSVIVKLEKNLLIMCKPLTGEPFKVKGKICAFKRFKGGVLRDMRDGNVMSLDFMKSELMRMVKDEEQVNKLILDLYNISDNDIAKFESENEDQFESSIDDIELNKEESIDEESEMQDAIEEMAIEND